MLNNQKELILLEDLGMLYPTETSKRKHRYGLYKCYCGIKFKAIATVVKNGHTKSCGCLHKEKTVSHGMTKHRIYFVWAAMMSRCNKKTNEYYKDYGERGIKVCDEWIDVENFINDMFPSYKEGLTIDRINNDGNYEPSNCRWVSKSIQSRNTRALRLNNTSGYRGVCCYKIRNKFTAQITVNSKNIHLGYFNTAIEAAEAYDKYILDNNLEHTKNF